MVQPFLPPSCTVVHEANYRDLVEPATWICIWKTWEVSRRPAAIVVMHTEEEGKQRLAMLVIRPELPRSQPRRPKSRFQSLGSPQNRRFRPNTIAGIV